MAFFKFFGWISRPKIYRFCSSSRKKSVASVRARRPLTRSAFGLAAAASLPSAKLLRSFARGRTEATDFFTLLEQNRDFWPRRPRLCRGSALLRPARRIPCFANFSNGGGSWSVSAVQRRLAVHGSATPRLSTARYGAAPRHRPIAAAAVAKISKTGPLGGQVVAWLETVYISRLSSRNVMLHWVIFRNFLKI